MSKRLTIYETTPVATKPSAITNNDITVIKPGFEKLNISSLNSGKLLSGNKSCKIINTDNSSEYQNKKEVLSTLASFVTAGAGVHVTKHGNYSVSSICGSSNVLEYLGIKFSNHNEFLKKC